MNVIKIKPESIQRNPDEGRTSTNIPGRISCEFQYSEEKPIPDGLVEGIDFMVHTTQVGSSGTTYYTAHLTSVDKIDLLTGFGENIEVQQDVHVMQHLPEPAYHFEYDKETPITCPECGHTTAYKDLPENDEGWLYCPECFEEIQIQVQTVEAAIAEHHIKL